MGAFIKNCKARLLVFFFITTKDLLNCKCDKLLLVSYMEGVSPDIGPSHGDHELSFQTFSTTVPAIKPWIKWGDIYWYTLFQFICWQQNHSPKEQRLLLSVISYLHVSQQSLLWIFFKVLTTIENVFSLIK